MRRIALTALGMAALAATGVGSPAAAQNVSITQSTTNPEARRSAMLRQIVSLVHGGRLDEAMLLIDPLLAEYDRLYADEKRTIFCAETRAETLLYLASAAAKTNRAGAVAIDRGWCLALWAKGYMLVDRKDYAGGAAYLERAIAMAPSHAHCLSELGFAYQAQRDWPRSIAAYTRAADGAALEDDPAEGRRQRGRAWRGIGFGLIELERLNEAEALFRKCLELDPSDDKAQGELDYIAERRTRKN